MLAFSEGGGRHPKGTRRGSGKWCLNFLPASQGGNDSFDFIPNTEVPGQEGFPEDSVVPLMPLSAHAACLQLWGFGGSRGSEGSPLLGAGLPTKEGHSIMECMLPDPLALRQPSLLLCWSILAL